MELPISELHPEFNITRASHVALSCRDVEKSLVFYTEVLGMIVSDRTGGRVYLRGIEEAAHHSIILEQANGNATCRTLGMRVFTEEDLERAYVHLGKLGLDCRWREDSPFQGRTLSFHDNCGTPIELCAHMDVRERMLNRTGQHRGGQAKRVDHFQIYVPSVQSSFEFYAALGFRASEYIEEAGKIVAAFLYRKGNTHDLVLFQGGGPQLHHVGLLVADGAAILRACDAAGELGFGEYVDRGPGRHGLDGSLFVYFRDPDGHRVELFDGHYQTIDTELQPRRWVPGDGRQPWGFPARETWFTECSAFEGVTFQKPESPASFFSLEEYLAKKLPLRN